MTPSIPHIPIAHTGYCGATVFAELQRDPHRMTVVCSFCGRPTSIPCRFRFCDCGRMCLKCALELNGVKQGG